MMINSAGSLHGLVLILLLSLLMVHICPTSVVMQYELIVIVIACPLRSFHTIILL